MPATSSLLYAEAAEERRRLRARLCREEDGVLVRREAEETDERACCPGAELSDIADDDASLGCGSDILPMAQ